ncbi:opacity protein-like surface antigen [Bosea sp. OAE752]|jgi:opacity protein-like surface antigen|uniref:Porin family protein n=1 Tax=Bosea spartocytisi TaxID=2773451 RepID=A0A927ED40_9HYPH|nr:MULTISPECIES: outer membrane beta-barrel protein [Bosea]MBD3848732.1 porin family protein [Bosea spartocytisi]MCT4473808.1 outer membrane beta-barrel protein [Bosea spartocytisi]
MGSLKSIALGGALALSAAAAAHAADFLPPPPPMEPPVLKGTISSGIYLRGDVGVGVQSVSKYHQDDVAEFGGSFFGKSDNSTFFAGLGIGYRFNNWLRFDVTGEYRGAGQIGVNDIVFNPFNNGNQTNTYKGNLTSLVTLFNGYFDLGTWNCLTPYIGAGIGFTQNRIAGLTDQGALFGNFVGPTLGYANTGTKTNVAWALMAGVGYEVNKNLTLELGYRYLNLGDAQSGRLINAFTGQIQGPLKAKDIDSHDFRIGMRWNFGDPNCCGTPEPAPVAYMPPPTVRKY